MKAWLANAMLTPWRATRASQRWVSIAIAAVFMLGAVAIGVLLPGPKRWLLCAILYAIGTLFLWTFWLPATLLLAIDARRMTLPCVQTKAIHGLLCYAVFTVGLPVVALQALPQTDSGLVALIAAAAVVGGLAFGLLPTYLITLVLMLPALQNSLKPILHLPSLPDLDWPTSLLISQVVLTTVVVLRWRQLVRGGADHVGSLRRPLVMQFHRLDTYGFLGSNPSAGSIKMLRQCPNWLQPRAALRDAGPHSRVLALRIALGGHYLPKTLASHLQMAAIALLQILCMASVLTLLLVDKHGKAFLLGNLELVAQAYIGGSCLLAATTMALLVGAQLHQRWQRTNAELPLLALLPGLGDAQVQRRNLLRASLIGPAATLAGAAVIVLATAWTLHLHGLNLLLVILPTPAALGVFTMLALRTYGGLALPIWGAWLLFTALLALLALSLLFPILSLVTHDAFVPVESWLLLAWIATALALAWLIQRGWHAFQHRPHPFLPAA